MRELAKNKKSGFIIYLLFLLILVLGAMNSCLYQKNSSYREANRMLIIQNDSILSININLKEELKAYKHAEISGIK